MAVSSSLLSCDGDDNESSTATINPIIDGSRLDGPTSSISQTPPLSTAELVELDRRHVWHPYAAVGTQCVPVRSTDGVHITLHDGTVLVDGMSSWWAAIHGYNHPHIIQSVQHQLEIMPHVMFGGLTHEPAVRLATRLAAWTGLPKVFLSDSGSVAVEVAGKMAIQYHIHRRRQIHGNNNNIDNDKTKMTGKTKFLTVRNGYHGDTGQCMSVSDPVNGMHNMFRNAIITPQFFAPQPTPAFHDDWNGASNSDNEEEDHLTEFRRLLERHDDEIAAVILEPIVQGAGGMRFYHPTYLYHVRKLCDEHDVLLIYDEIATGFGRTGKLFAKDHCHGKAEPDIMCLGKALTGGTMSLAATLTSDKVAAVFGGGGAGGVLMHGPTFMGNPLACAAANASLDLIETGDWRHAVPAIAAQLRKELECCRESPHVRDVRVLGAIGVVELERPIVNLKQMVPEIVRHGVWLRPFGRLLYAMPPYIIQPDQLRQITRAMVQLSRKLF